MQASLPFDTEPVDPSADAPLLVRHPRAKRYVIRLTDDGRVRVTIPRWGSKRGALEFVASEAAWIAKERDRHQQRRHEIWRPADGPLRARATRELPERLLELARVHRLNVSRISIRNQKWRWGSCSPSGHICLNWRLVAVPPAVRDYVLIHELMHLKRLDHSRKFWKLVEQACPDYRQHRAYLRSLR
ncbi:MAG TPA: M48 family metallopeptidase [Vicinamibacterales bacterium]|jgi:hypothetical protein